MRNLCLPRRRLASRAIVGNGNTLLLRFSPARGYYLYRDKTSLRLDAGGAIACRHAALAAGTPHRDEHFGT